MRPIGAALRVVRAYGRPFAGVLSNQLEPVRTSPGAALGYAAERARHLASAVAKFTNLSTRIVALKHEIGRRARQDDTPKRLMTIPVIGPVTATAVEALAPLAETFDRGRGFAGNGLVKGLRAIPVGTQVSPRAPQTDPSMRCKRTRIPFRVSNEEATLLPRMTDPAGGNRRAAIPAHPYHRSDSARRRCHKTKCWKSGPDRISFAINGLGSREGSTRVPLPPPANSCIVVALRPDTWRGACRPWPVDAPVPWQRVELLLQFERTHRLPYDRPG